MLSKTTKFALSAALLAMLPATMAPAQPVTLDGLEVQLKYPKPWPLENLVTDGKLTIVTTGKTKGETIVNDAGELEGARIDLWTKLAADLGLEPVFVRSDWAGVMPGLAANRYDLGCEGASWTDERLTSKDFFLTRPIKVQVNVALVRSDSGIDSWDDMAGKKLGGVKGENELKSLADKVGVPVEDTLGLPGVTESRMALLNRQIDAYGTGLTAASVIMAGEGGDQFRMLAEPSHVGVGGFCVNARQPDLLTAVNFLIAQYRADGTIQALNEKWGLPDTSDLLTKIGY